MKLFQRHISILYNTRNDIVISHAPYVCSWPGTRTCICQATVHKCCRPLLSVSTIIMTRTAYSVSAVSLLLGYEGQEPPRHCHSHEASHVAVGNTRRSSTVHVRGLVQPELNTGLVASHGLPHEQSLGGCKGNIVAVTLYVSLLCGVRFAYRSIDIFVGTIFHGFSKKSWKVYMYM